jgi:hypothetical protein
VTNMHPSTAGYGAIARVAADLMAGAICADSNYSVLITPS